ncbi:MAG: serine/threonine-protein phosphatase [Lachnospiraceae bacterium]|nr:serine/threonine-protein phosphatase [Lachnospiraceae bacterium]
MEFIASASTDIGNVKKTNQDSLNVRVISSSAGNMVFAVLCDGMGGLAKGEVASATVLTAFRNWSNEVLPKLCVSGIDDDVIREEWTKLARECNEKIKIYGKRSACNLGTTLTAMLLTEERYYIVNVGDTRAYEIFNYVAVLTKDQTVVAREVELGNLTPEQAETDPRRSVLLQCIGSSDVVYPEFFFGETKKGAVYMLCSDGFRHEITTDDIFYYFKPDRMLDSESMRVGELTLIELNKQREERDNISVITVKTY